MNIGAKYLRKVNMVLRCPHRRKSKFLRQLKEDVLDYCGTHPCYTLEALEAQFGKPEDVAADFYAQSDPGTVSRYAYTRLRFAYGLLAVLLLISVSVISVNAVRYRKTQQLIGQPHTAQIFVHPNGKVCDEFTVRTNYQGRDVYWQYHSCLGGLWLTCPPEDSDGSEPYATDVYLNHNGTIEHWTYSDDNFHWMRVLDTDIKKEG